MKRRGFRAALQRTLRGMISLNHMIINLNKLLHLPVYTESGVRLGRVYELEIDVDMHVVMRYLVRPNVFSPKYFLIKNSQIKDITADKVIVYDNVLKVNPAKSLGNIISGPEEDM